MNFDDLICPASNFTCTVEDAEESLHVRYNAFHYNGEGVYSDGHAHLLVIAHHPELPTSDKDQSLDIYYYFAEEVGPVNELMSLLKRLGKFCRR